VFGEAERVKQKATCIVSGLCRRVNEFIALLWCYAV